MLCRSRRGYIKDFLLQAFALGDVADRNRDARTDAVFPNQHRSIFEVLRRAPAYRLRTGKSTVSPVSNICASFSSTRARAACGSSTPISRPMIWSIAKASTLLLTKRTRKRRIEQKQSVRRVAWS